MRIGSWSEEAAAGTDACDAGTSLFARGRHLRLAGILAIRVSNAGIQHTRTNLKQIEEPRQVLKNGNECIASRFIDRYIDYIAFVFLHE